MLSIKRALISVSDKSNLEPFVKELTSHGIEIISTGGTAKFISALGIKVIFIDEVTGFPEMLDGRLKTLHPKIHGGLLAIRGNSEHMQQLKDHSIKTIDMVVVNLYPFKKTVAKESVTLTEAIENIDIGGPTMLRSAAKNYSSVAVVTNPSQYSNISEELKKNSGSISDDTLSELAVEVFRLTSTYDEHIYNYLDKKRSPETDQDSPSNFPKHLKIEFDKVEDLRYGENSHQRSAFYKRRESKEASISNATKLHGKALSYNNIMDMDAALSVVKEFEAPTACIIKHSTPCGLATAETLTKAYTDALSCDEMSAFGGIIALNKKVDVNTAEAILNSGFKECVIAPGFEQNALNRLTSKENLRLLTLDSIGKTRDKDQVHLRDVVGGLLVQERDLEILDQSQIRIVTNTKPTSEEVESLLFAWKAVKYIKSNAIVLVQGTKSVGIGAGQMSRVDSVFMAIHKASDKAKGSVLASDAFFPKEDAIEEAAKSGITSIIQPGGSKADDEIIAVCNKHNISMVFTGIRHFRH